MSSDPKTVALIVDQVGGAASGVTARAMFGEYGLYLGGKLVALVCDDQLFVKPTPASRAYAQDAGEAPPYLRAKPCLVIDANRWADHEWLAELFRRTAAELPLPKLRRKRMPRPGSNS